MYPEQEPQNQPNNEAYQPNIQFQPENPTTTPNVASPNFSATTTYDTPNIPTQNVSTPSQNSSKITTPGVLMKNKKLMMIVSAIVILLIGTIVAVVIMSGSKSVNKDDTPQTSTTDQSLVPAAATADSLQQTNTSIGQDVSGIDNAKDFPASRLDDKTLGL